MRVVSGAPAVEKSWDEKRRIFLDNAHKELAATWTNHSMPWVNLHVSGYR